MRDFASREFTKTNARIVVNWCSMLHCMCVRAWGWRKNKLNLFEAESSIKRFEREFFLPCTPMANVQIKRWTEKPWTRPSRKSKRTSASSFWRKFCRRKKSKREWNEKIERLSPLVNAIVPLTNIYWFGTFLAPKLWASFHHRIYDLSALLKYPLKAFSFVLILSHRVCSSSCLLSSFHRHFLYAFFILSIRFYVKLFGEMKTDAIRKGVTHMCEFNATQP